MPPPRKLAIVVSMASMVPTALLGSVASANADVITLYCMGETSTSYTYSQGTYSPKEFPITDETTIISLDRSAGTVNGMPCRAFTEFDITCDYTNDLEGSVIHGTYELKRSTGKLLIAGTIEHQPKPSWEVPTPFVLTFRCSTNIPPNWPTPKF